MIIAWFPLFIHHAAAQDSSLVRPSHPGSMTVSPDLRQQYLKSAKRRNTAGWVMLTTGTVIGVIGLVNYENYENNKLDNWGDEIVAGTTGIAGMVIGGALIATSVPFFITAHSYKQKAARLSVSLDIQQYRQVQPMGLTTHIYPAVGIRIGL